MDKMQLLAGAAVLTGVAGVTALFTIQGMAKEEILFTFCPPGAAKLLVKGGDLSDVILNLPGSHINSPYRPYYKRELPDWEILPNEEGTKDRDYEHRDFLSSMTGAYWKGFLREPYTYHQYWEERNDHRGKDHPGKYRKRGEDTSIVVVSDFDYILETEPVEASDGPSVQMLYSLTIRINNPVKAVYKADNWLNSIESLADTIARNYMGSRPLMELKSEKKTANGKHPTQIDAEATPWPGDEDAKKRAQDHLEQFILPYNKGGVNPLRPEEGTQDRWGVTIVRVNVLDITPVGDLAKKHIELLSREFTERREAEANYARATGQAAVTVLNAATERKAAHHRAEATKLELAALASQPEISLARIASDAIKGSNSTVVFGTNLVDTLGDITKTLTRSKAND